MSRPEATAREQIDASLDQAGWLVQDADQRLPVAGAFESAWRLLALSGGRPFTCVGEWDGERLTPLGVLVDGGWLSLATPQ